MARLLTMRKIQPKVVESVLQQGPWPQLLPAGIYSSTWLAPGVAQSGSPPQSTLPGWRLGTSDSRSKQGRGSQIS